MNASTAAVASHTSSSRLLSSSMWRTADIIADATLEILNNPDKSNGRALIDEEFLKEVGYTDFDQYKCQEDSNPLPLNSDIMRMSRS